MKVRGFGQQDRVKVGFSRRDCERLWKIAQKIPESATEAIVEVRLTPENDYGWELPQQAGGAAQATGESIDVVSNAKWHLRKYHRPQGRVIRTP